MHVPEELSTAANQTLSEPSKWIALCPKGKGDTTSPRYTWPLDADRPIGERDLTHWLSRCIRARGCPVRIQWRANSGKLLAEATIWDDTRHDEAPTLAEALMPANGDLYVPSDGEKQSSFERGVTMLLERPETIMTVVQIVKDAFKGLGSPDELALQAYADKVGDIAAERAARAVESKIEEIMRNAGILADDEAELDAEAELAAEAELDAESANVVLMHQAEHEETDHEEAEHEETEQANHQVVNSGS